MHRTIEQALRTYIQSDESAWEDISPAAELATNCRAHNSTGLTPFEVMIGENPLRAGDLDVVDVLEPPVTPSMTKLFQQLVYRASAHILWAQAQQKQKPYADRKRREVEFHPGDEVWLSTRFMQPRGASKFQPRFIGPFKLVSKVGKVAHRLNLPPSMQQHPVFHVSLLQAHKPRTAEMMQPQGWKPVQEAEYDEEPICEVERILNSRGHGTEEEFLVQWKGSPASAATPLSHLDGCKDLLRAFRTSRTRRRKKTS